MKKSLFYYAASIGLLFTLGFAHADETWLGNLVVRNNHRGIVTTAGFTGQTFFDNLADYNDFSVSFEFYKRGVTDIPGTQVWKVVDARVELVKDSTQEVISKGVLEIAGANGNNVVYRLSLQKINPSTVAGYDAEMNHGGIMRSHLNLIFDDTIMVSIPFGYSYVP
ncbi:MAG: hypothetical protein ACXVA9_01945 [Bdellovibrionales bacterium]